ncbi:hypothetical protein H114_32619 [Streptomyces gancidicus BKS 13-15]|uniref:Uncharacterized protein n=1 Tax=Streptomyces gancidicus BKS 13-15 TaxID=1284664 RepID=M3CSA0_STREZ|nr:hypothetical protein [Streptomyces gancidicus]EMF20385.1 hypothetical protein H114_32619 [Streptomyces gancidicus BKS 13-15]
MPASTPTTAPTPADGCPGPARPHCACCGSHGVRPADLLDNGDTYCCGAPVCRGDRAAVLDAHEKAFTAP